jgi:peptidoglycan/xylan/chitin deacetylase (PgdA/CDA1 family)
MLSSTLSRFQIARVIALLLAVLAIWLRSAPLFSLVALGFTALIGLGVKIPQLRLFGPYICRGTEKGKKVALTFDDGPDPRSTPALLEVLREAKVEAAFFCIGKRVAENPALATSIVREGHLVENHSYSHSNATNVFTEPRLQAELEKTQAVIEKATGVAPKCFRPPLGLSNPRTFRVARRMGLRVVGWTTRGFDTKLTEPKLVVKRVLRKLKPNAIILLHDGNIPAERLVTTVKMLLENLKTLGYEIVRLDKILA